MSSSTGDSVPSLESIAIAVLRNFTHRIGYVGMIPDELIRAVLEQAPREQLERIQRENPDRELPFDDRWNEFFNDDFGYDRRFREWTPASLGLPHWRAVYERANKQLQDSLREIAATVQKQHDLDSSRQQIQKVSGTSLGDRGNRSLRKRRQSDHEPEGVALREQVRFERINQALDREIYRCSDAVRVQCMSKTLSLEEYRKKRREAVEKKDRMRNRRQAFERSANLSSFSDTKRCTNPRNAAQKLEELKKKAREEANKMVIRTRNEILSNVQEQESILRLPGKTADRKSKTE